MSIYGVVNLTRINTDPGASTALAPPEHWKGTYWEFFQRQLKDPGARQHIFLASERVAKKEACELYGKYSEDAYKALMRFATEKRKLKC